MDKRRMGVIGCPLAGAGFVVLGVLHCALGVPSLQRSVERGEVAARVGVVLKSYQADAPHNTVVWQNSIGPWRNVRKLIPAADDGTLTKAEYDAAATQDPSLATRMPFATIDTDADGIVNAAEMARVEGVRETEGAFRAAGRTNLTVHIYPGHGHDLNWTPKTTGNGGPVPFQDAFRFAADLVRPR